ncbi:NAD(P)H-dependent flavin oxidoreductase [Faucicola boevrei]|uniref:NAD(P)H-dependent flavin oxidoreductase n=1 Tax=Faucicola boevrei TaxID=346665 RepID=UPI00036E7A90|nr:nitronate monooxygenase [Moraxella boevrei]
MSTFIQFLQESQTKPLIQAPMAGVQNSKLAIAVCQENAIGSLPCAMLSADKIEQEIIKIQQATNTPFNVNFYTLQKFYDEFNIDNQNIALTGARQPFNRENAELIADLKVPIVSFHFGLPDDDLLTMVKQSGAKILATATTVNEAKFLANKGVDAIIAQGIEAGGHRGMFLDKDLTTQSGTFSLLPNIAKLLKNSDITLIGAGGISDNITVKSAFGLGADLVQIGTAFLLADECDTKPTHKFLLQI